MNSTLQKKEVITRRLKRHDVKIEVERLAVLHKLKPGLIPQHTI